MNWFPGLHTVASIAFERLWYCLAEGSLLVVAVALAMRFVRHQSSRTKFVIWFSALLATAFLPMLGVKLSGEAASMIPSKAVVTLPLSIALYVFAAWILLACAGLIRVLAGVRQLRRLRAGCEELDAQQLGPELTHTIEDFRTARRVSLLVSKEVQVPTAVGFFKPAVIIPAWMLEEGASDELRHVMLHELAHLRRRDDWTNLIKKVVKAVLFFHPGVWWMEKELSLHREMACDDEVLAETGNPRSYAESLARVAERNFLRRQIAMAQAAVSKMRQLSTRVTRILDPNRGQSTKIWKPAVPAVVALALVSGASVSWVPNLVKVDDGASSVSTQAASRSSSSVMPSAAPQLAPPVHPSVRAWPASLRSDRTNQTHARSLYVPARATSVKKFTPVRTLKTQTAKAKAQHQEHAPVILAKFEAPTGQGKVQSDAAAQPQEQQQRFVLVIETRQTVTAGANGLQVSVQQLRWLVPVNRIQKQLPSKT